MREIHDEVAAGVATRAVDRPGERGAMADAMLDELTARGGQAGADDAVRVLPATGTPGSSCSGGTGPALRLLHTGAGTDLRSHAGATRAAPAECLAAADHAEGGRISGETTRPVHRMSSAGATDSGE